jgi:general secretion pathway protein C
MKKAAWIANCAAAALLGVVLAYWSWAWLAPPAAARAPAVLELATGGSSTSGLFGKAQQAAPAAAGNVQLMGVLAASGGRRGHAVLRLDGKKTLAVLQGEEVEPGVRLAEVRADGVVLERNGARETLAWPAKAAK